MKIGEIILQLMKGPLDDMTQQVNTKMKWMVEKLPLACMSTSLTLYGDYVDKTYDMTLMDRYIKGLQTVWLSIN